MRSGLMTPPVPHLDPGQPIHAPAPRFSLRGRRRLSTLYRRLLLGALLVVPVALPWALPVAASGSTYYVDCAGSDSRAGTSTDTAWKTLGKANAAPLAPGDSLLLRRGCSWTGPLNASWRGTSSASITIGAYGSGAQPLIRDAHENVAITGAYLVIRDLATTAAPTSHDSSCQNWPLGYRVGFRFYSGANHVTVRDSTASGLYMGVMVNAGATDNRVYRNTLRDNDMRDPNVASDAGAVGVLLEGDRTEVSWNTISGSDACSPQYGRDGAAVEIYGGRDNKIHHNIATQNNAFTELGNSRSANNTFAYNRITSTLTAANVLVTRGANDSHGPVTGTRFHSNTAYLTGSQSYAIQCTGGCSSSILSMRDNIIWADDRVGYADASFDERNNIYWRAGGSPKVYFAISSTSRLVNPGFVSSSDLHLKSGSPAIDAGSGAALALGYTTDLSAVAVPQGQAPDIGAYERATGGATPTPTPGSTATPRPTATPAPAPLAVDSFSRTVSGGWGATDPGGVYGLAGGSEGFAVDGAVGAMTLKSGRSLAATLVDVAAKNVVVRTSVRVSRLMGGSGEDAWVVLRRTATGNAYRLRVRISSSGAVKLRAFKRVRGRTVAISRQVSAGVTLAPGKRLWIRARVVGANPARLKLRVWKGSHEPARWQLVVKNGASALAGPGAIGLRASVPSRSGGKTVRFTFDDLRAWRP